MPQNVFSAGRDELLHNLAARDASARLDEEQRRRAAADEAAAAARTEQLGLQRRNTEALEGQRNAQTAEIERATKEKSERDATIERLITVVTDTTQDPKLRDAAGLRLDSMGIGKEMLSRFMTQPKKEAAPATPFTLAPGGRRYNAEGELVATAPDRPKEPKEPTGGFKDSHTLPEGVKTWIDSIKARGVPLDDARKELALGFPQQKAVHKHVDPAQALEYLGKLYPPTADPFSLTPKSAGGIRPDAATHAAPAEAAPVAPAADIAASRAPVIPADAKRVPVPGHPEWEAVLVNGKYIRVK